MAKNSIRDYSATNSLNTDIQSIDISEGCSPAGINNAIREVMADLKDVSTGAVALESPSADSLTVTGDLTVDTNTLYVDSTNDRVGIGTTSPDEKLHILAGSAGTVTASTNANLVVENSANSGLNILTPNNLNGQILFGDPEDNDVGRLQYNHASNYMAFYTNAAERMRIASDGRVHINQTSDWASSMLSAYATGAPALSARTNQTNGTCLITRHDGGGTAYNVQFYNGASFVGSIQTTASSTSYVTSSDYRLKENVTDITDATTRLKQLNPVRFNFIADADTTVDGFLAHEVQAVVPEAISGTKDAVDDEGNPVYQGIDQSKLVPLLVKTIQELEARITALEAN